MADSPSTEILNGIIAYLRDEFPGVNFIPMGEARTRSVILHADSRPHRRLEITKQFLDGEQGASIPLQRVRDWNVAQALRDANGRLVSLATTGVRIG